jgi:hypothetical protein
MNDNQSPRRQPTPGAGMVVFRGDEVLLIKRGKPPYEGPFEKAVSLTRWDKTRDVIGRARDMLAAMSAPQSRA